MPQRGVTPDGSAAPTKRKRRYTMSAKALEQRRTAALRHGERARGVLSRGAGLSRADRKAFERAAKALERAIARGDRGELEPVVIEALAPLYPLLREEAEALFSEGLVHEEQILTGKTELVATGKTLPDGRPELVESAVVLKRCRPNPRAKQLVELARLLGADAREQGTTPRSSTQEPGADSEIEKHWERMREMEEATGSAVEP